LEGNVAKKRSVKPDGDAVRQARLAKGWRPEDLARHADCSLRTVENAERSASVYANTLATIALALGVDFKTLLAKTGTVSHTNDMLRTKASIIIAINPDDPPAEEQVIAELAERASLMDEVAVGTTQVDRFRTAPDGGLLINMTLTYRDARKLADTLRTGNLGTLDVCSFSAPDCWIWMFSRPLVEPE
jgi:transcriptional regulator with XRE-family HTH domain